MDTKGSGHGSFHKRNTEVGGRSPSPVAKPPRSTQPGHPSVGKRNEYQRKLERKRGHRVMP